ncbi:hypothetical protein L596_011342 [Steinernema carpocapsae]|uniref:Uncharacterized protein n=1 Tax=Steinernema carpocapsae TaxID=34508 RepID=A0A4U5NTJ9_STECR|nr:hypothetical protein L596_011342 [Steinernema carpocapsae]
MFASQALFEIVFQTKIHDGNENRLKLMMKEIMQKIEIESLQIRSGLTYAVNGWLMEVAKVVGKCDLAKEQLEKAFRDHFKAETIKMNC